MRVRNRLLVLLALCAVPRALSADTADLDNVRHIAARLESVEATAETRDVNVPEFQKLKKNARILQFKRLHFYYKTPDKFRVDSRGRELLHVSMIQNGDRKTFRTSLGLRKSQDVGDEPAKKQGPLDFGMLSAALWSEYHILPAGEESVDGVPCAVFKMTLIEDPRYGYNKVWLDRKTFRLVRRDKYTREGHLKVRHLFKEPERSPAGVWYSRRIELHSPEGKFVGALQLSEVRVNHGVADTLFR